MEDTSANLIDGITVRERKDGDIIIVIHKASLIKFLSELTNDKTTLSGYAKKREIQIMKGSRIYTHHLPLISITTANQTDASLTSHDQLCPVADQQITETSTVNR